jgi:predicted NAD/FAD-binding protein
MTAAIWSAPPDSVSTMPARFLLRFFANHGMLSIDDRPQWQTIRGGSARYVEKLVAGHRARIRTGTRVTAVSRVPRGAIVRTRDSEPETFDAVFLACHSDEALALLTDASPLERAVLGAIRYRSNDAVLHTDGRLLPRCRRAWASWNYRVVDDESAPPLVTYHMNTLQRLTAPAELCVTLNDAGRVAPQRVLGRYRYEHPLFDAAAIAAQKRHAEIDGARHTYFCGAYWRNGFHEDGVVSALEAVEHFREREGHAQLHLRRAS